MIEAIPVVLADLASAIVAAAARPWRYVLSPTYRARARGELDARGALARCWYLGWGSLALLASIALAGAAAALVAQARGPARAPDRDAVQRAGASIAREAMHSPAASAAEKAAAALRR